jgi:glycosyltransferase involved in cell wall biosynthesis
VVIASDDGSTDQTLEILWQYQARWSSGRLTIRSGPQKGFCQNFLSLACDPEIKADYYAFCDQDDVWLPAKLEVALANIIANQSVDVPYLYCGRTKYVTENLKPCGISPLFVFPPSFRNALVQSIAGGNTMVFNQPAKNLIEKVGVVNVPSHDWWVYQLTSGADGTVYYEQESYILYRQHSQSQVGQNQDFFAKLKRLSMLLHGRFKRWNDLNLRALSVAKHELSKHNAEILFFFLLLRDASLKDRFRLMEICGLYRQTWGGSISLMFAAIIKKL